MIATLVLILYLLVSGIHLIDSWNDDAKRRAKTKPFLLLLLLLFYAFSNTHHSIPLYLALFTSWLGDVLLIPKGHKWFTMGGISFLFSHFFFILVFLSKIQLSNIPFFIYPIALLYFGISFIIIHMVKPTTPKKMIIPMYFYLLANSTMNVFALIQLIHNQNSASLIAYIGALLFFISDCTLFLVRYYKDETIIFKKHFTVMLTYLLGELLITIGVILLHR